MKRKIVFALAGVLFALVAVVLAYRWLTAHGSAGYVIIGIGQWVLETSLYVVAVATLATFVALYVLLRLMARAASLPKTLKQRGDQQRVRRSQEALVTGLLEATVGNWEKAERSLIRHAADSGTPLINYLTAAKAAHARGAHEQREEYFRLAHQSVPSAELAVAITRAELQLSSRQFDEALDSLTQLNRLAPGHAVALRLMHQLYAQMGDFDALHHLIPALSKNKVLNDTEIRRLETETYTVLLQRKAETRNPAALREVWARIPQHVRELTRIESLYCAAMIESGAGAEIEETLRLALGRDWDQTLLVLYGCIPLADTEGQIRHVEEWLNLHPNDPVLLRVLGKLALRIKQWEKARDYLGRSLEAGPSVEAYQLMGDLLHAQKDYVAASESFRKGMLLASSGAVAEIEEAAEVASPVDDVAQDAAEASDLSGAAPDADQAKLDPEQDHVG